MSKKRQRDLNTSVNSSFDSEDDDDDYDRGFVYYANYIYFGSVLMNMIILVQTN